MTKIDLYVKAMNNIAEVLEVQTETEFEILVDYKWNYDEVIAIFTRFQPDKWIVKQDLKVLWDVVTNQIETNGIHEFHGPSAYYKVKMDV